MIRDAHPETRRGPVAGRYNGPEAMATMVYRKIDTSVSATRSGAAMFDGCLSERRNRLTATRRAVRATRNAAAASAISSAGVRFS